MERLTLDEILKFVNKAAVQMELDNCKECSENYKQIAEYIEELRSYKDLEEQGLLIRLPCPLGTTVYDICGTDIHKNVVDGIEYGENGRYFLWSDKGGWLGAFNDLVFLTREEAEKKLKEMRSC